LKIGKKGSEVQNASFADMGEAIEHLLSESSTNDDEDSTVSLSDNHSLVLACAWLNLKETALVASSSVSTFASAMSESQLKLFGIKDSGGYVLRNLN